MSALGPSELDRMRARVAQLEDDLRIEREINQDASRVVLALRTELNRLRGEPGLV